MDTIIFFAIRLIGAVILLTLGLNVGKSFEHLFLANAMFAMAIFWCAIWLHIVVKELFASQLDQLGDLLGAAALLTAFPAALLFLDPTTVPELNWPSHWTFPRREILTIQSPGRFDLHLFRVWQSIFIAGSIVFIWVAALSLYIYCARSFDLDLPQRWNPSAQKAKAESVSLHQLQNQVHTLTKERDTALDKLASTMTELHSANLRCSAAMQELVSSNAQTELLLSQKTDAEQKAKYLEGKVDKLQLQADQYRATISRLTHKHQDRLPVGYSIMPEDHPLKRSDKSHQ